MGWVFWWLLVVTVVLLFLFAMVLRSSKAVRKEVNDVKTAIIEAGKDFKVTAEERDGIVKEIKEVSFLDALKEFVSKTVKKE
jgi:hypothetical protein